DDLTIDNKKLPENVNNFFMRIEEGSKVSFPENNVTKCGNIIASAGERETAVFAAENAARSVLIRLNPNDTQTAAFLETKTNFPPDAFNITDALRNELNNLPDAPHSPLNILHSTFIIHPFPAFQSSGLRDYMGRTVQETLDAVRKITGFSLPVSAENAENIETPQNAVMLGRSFWAALIRGSYQGAAYYIDSPGAK
ncbi:MAG: hypothetical protein FWC03_12565, partial [Treponema sp.]|nr:hypothetical protein [Treponema sp.]